MPQVIVTETATQGLERCRQFLAEKAPEASQNASSAIAKQLESLEQNPDIGRPLPDDKKLRELIIPYGNSGYVALYRYEPEHSTVYILAFRHQKEAGY